MSNTYRFKTERGRIAMTQAASRRLFEYWMRLKGQRAAPDRSEIEPADIGPILRDTFILERADDEAMRYRLAGTRLCGLSGSELRGEDWLDGWNRADREALVTMFRTMAREAAAAVMLVAAANERGQQIRLETLVLPLANREQGLSRIIGTTVALDQPYWLGSQALVTRAISDLQLIWPDELDRVSDLDADAVARAAAPQPIRWRGHLAVYDGGLGF